MGVQLDDQRPLLTPPGEGEVVTDRPERTLRILGELDELIVTWFRYAVGEKGPSSTSTTTTPTPSTCSTASSS
jgi:hypothetical protein